MSATIAEIRDGLVDVLGTGTPADVSIERHLVDTITAPAVVVGSIFLDPATFDGSSRFTAEIHAVASRGSVTQLDVIDELIDPANSESIWAVIEANQDLAGAVSSIVPMSAGNYRELPLDAGYYAATVRCEGYT